jgi:hypothetical protein
MWQARFLNEHWEPVSAAQCQPCFIRYHYVVKLETQRADAARVIQGLLGPHHRGLDTVSNRKGHGKEGSHDGCGGHDSYGQERYWFEVMVVFIE